jgi:hypothetical protein
MELHGWTGHRKTKMMNHIYGILQYPLLAQPVVLPAMMMMLQLLLQVQLVLIW